jgi:hypothetical protein
MTLAARPLRRDVPGAINSTLGTSRLLRGRPGAL